MLVFVSRVVLSYPELMTEGKLVKGNYEEDPLIKISSELVIGGFSGETFVFKLRVKMEKRSIILKIECSFVKLISMFQALSACGNFKISVNSLS